jgi:hypothetical protein
VNQHVTIQEAAFSVGLPQGNITKISGSCEIELREALKVGVGDEKTLCVMVWFVKCSNKLYKCAINPVINPKLVYKSRTSPYTYNIYYYRPFSNPMLLLPS